MTRHRPVAAIDVGSNSVFLQVVDVREGRQRTVLSRIKHKARLGAALGEDNVFSDAAMDATVTAFRGFAAVIAEYDAEVLATATAAVRRASNGGLLLARIREATGIDVRVISGREEAELVLLGVTASNSMPPRLLCADVGGGSSELFVGHDNVLQQLVSLPVGAVTLSHPHLMRAPVTETALARCLDVLHTTLGQVGPEFSTHVDLAVATSGTAQRIARINQAMRGEEPRPDVDGEVFTAADLRTIRTMLLDARSHTERLAVPGIDPERADVLLGGVLIFESLSERLGVERWTVSMAGLRAGLVERVVRRRASQ